MIPTGGGQPLDSTVRARMETSFDHDFSKVRVHSGHEASSMALAMSADAYTIGNDIVFGRRSYAPHTASGDLLIGHELAHVVQQSRGAGATLGCETHERAAHLAAHAALGGSGPVHAGPRAARAIQRQATPAAPAPTVTPATIMAEIDAELGAVEPIVQRLTADAIGAPGDVTLNVARAVAGRLAQDERVIAEFAAYSEAPPGAAVALSRVTGLRATMQFALATAERWHAANPIGESLEMTNERWGTAAAGYGAGNWEAGNYVRGAAGYVGAFGVAFLDAGEDVLAVGFHESATAVSKAYTSGDISWNESERLLHNAMWRSLLTAAASVVAGAAAGRLAGLATRGLGLAPEALATGVTRGAIVGGVGAAGGLGGQALTTQALKDESLGPVAQKIWAKGMPSGRDWLIAIPAGMLTGGLFGARATQTSNARLVGTLVDTPGGRMRVVTITRGGSWVLEPEGAGLRTPPPPPQADIVMVYDPESGSWRPQAGGSASLAARAPSPPKPGTPPPTARPAATSGPKGAPARASAPPALRPAASSAGVRRIPNLLPAKRIPAPNLPPAKGSTVGPGPDELPAGPTAPLTREPQPSSITGSTPDVKPAVPHVKPDVPVVNPGATNVKPKAKKGTPKAKPGTTGGQAAVPPAQGVVRLSSIARPATLTDELIHAHMAMYRASESLLWARLEPLRQTPFSGDAIDVGRFNILLGNMGEIESGPMQQARLADVAKTTPNARLEANVTIQLPQPGSTPAQPKLGAPKLFTDGMIASESGGNLYVSDVYEVKAGRQGGAEATSQVFDWVEGRLEDGATVTLSNGRRYRYAPSETGPGRIINLARAQRHLIAPKGAAQLGARSSEQLGREPVREELPVTAAELKYLARRALEDLSGSGAATTPATPPATSMTTSHPGAPTVVDPGHKGDAQK